MSKAYAKQEMTARIKGGAAWTKNDHDGNGRTKKYSKSSENSKATAREKSLLGRLCKRVGQGSPPSVLAAGSKRKNPSANPARSKKSKSGMSTDKPADAAPGASHAPASDAGAPGIAATDQSMLVADAERVQSDPGGSGSMDDVEAADDEGDGAGCGAEDSPMREDAVNVTQENEISDQTTAAAGSGRNIPSDGVDGGASGLDADVQGKTGDSFPPSSGENHEGGVRADGEGECSTGSGDS